MNEVWRACCVNFQPVLCSYRVAVVRVPTSRRCDMPEDGNMMAQKSQDTAQDFKLLVWVHPEGRNTAQRPSYYKGDEKMLQEQKEETKMKGIPADKWGHYWGQEIL